VVLDLQWLSSRCVHRNHFKISQFLGENFTESIQDYAKVCGLDNYNAEIELGMVMVKVSFGCCSFENY